MGRPSLGEHAKSEVCAVRLTKQAREDMDRLRGTMTRSQWIRKLILDERQRRGG